MKPEAERNAMVQTIALNASGDSELRADYTYPEVNPIAPCPNTGEPVMGSENGSDNGSDDTLSLGSGTFGHGGVPSVDGRSVTEKFNRHFIGNLARSAKVQFGCPLPTVANKNMVRRWVRDEMRSQNMRIVEMEKWLDRIVSHVFIPSEYDLESREVLMTRYARSRMRRYRGDIWWWFSRITEPFVLE